MKSSNGSSSIATVGFSFLALILSVAVVVTQQQQAAYAQQLPIEKANVNPTTRVFTSQHDSFRVNVPTGWVIEDIDTNKMIPVEIQLGYTILAILCPQEQALPAIGGLWNCEDADSQVTIYRDVSLGSRPEFAAVGDPAKVTLDDYVAYQLQNAQKPNEVTGRSDFGNMHIVNTTDRVVNIAPDNAKVYAKLMELTYTPNSILRSQEIRAFTLLTLVYDEIKNTGVTILEGTPAAATAQANGEARTGYRMSYEDFANITPSGRLPSPAVEEIFSTFGFVR